MITGASVKPIRKSFVQCVNISSATEVSMIQYRLMWRLWNIPLNYDTYVALAFTVWTGHHVSLFHFYRCSIPACCNRNICGTRRTFQNLQIFTPSLNQLKFSPKSGRFHPQCLQCEKLSAEVKCPILAQHQPSTTVAHWESSHFFNYSTHSNIAQRTTREMVKTIDTWRW